MYIFKETVSYFTQYVKKYAKILIKYKIQIIESPTLKNPWPYYSHRQKYTVESLFKEIVKLSKKTAVFLFFFLRIEF